MGKTKIDWADRTWNPVTGCLHGCPYCYAEKIANRFGLPFAPKLGDPGMEGAFKYDSCEGLDTMLELQKPYKVAGKIQPYPMGFLPTFHRYRLDEPQKIKKPSNIFVCSMADLFGEWVSDEWIKEVFKSCEAAPQHNYIFLTKNPKRYNKYFRYSKRPKNWFFGASASKYNDMVSIRQTLANSLNFLSIEPIFEDVDIGKFIFENPKSLEWVIIGAESGNRKDKVIPQREWIVNIAEECKERNVPIFMKESLRSLMGDNFAQEFPERLKHE